MNKLLILLFSVLTISSYAQITLETTYATGSVAADDLRIVKLSSSGYKFAINDTDKIVLYNLNHTVFKTINFPSIPDMYGEPVILYISEELFDTDPTDVEYFFLYNDANYTRRCRVFDESGNTLFAKDTANEVVANAFDNYHENFIVHTSSGTKMTISDCPGKKAYVYSLPGFLACHDCTNGVTTTRINTTESPTVKDISNYPNPTGSQTTIVYDLPKEVSIADLVIYSITGQEIKRFKVSSVFHDIIIDTNDLSSGTYYYQIQTSTGYSQSKKMVVVK